MGIVRKMRFIETLREGERISEVYLCRHKQTAMTKAGKPYDSLTLQDKTGTLDAKIWDVSSNGIEEFDSLDYIYNCDLLIIDDLGTELANTFTTSQLFSCLNERILRRKSTIISTNLALDDIKTIYSERIFSRISSHYTMLRLTGDDIRIQKKLLNLGGTNDVTP